jgi:hypothetical protein
MTEEALAGGIQPDVEVVHHVAAGSCNRVRGEGRQQAGKHPQERNFIETNQGDLLAAATRSTKISAQIEKANPLAKALVLG